MEGVWGERCVMEGCEGRGVLRGVVGKRGVNCLIAHVQALMSLNGGLLLDWWRAIGTWERTVWSKNTMPALMASLVIGVCVCVRVCVCVCVCVCKNYMLSTDEGSLSA